MVVYIRHANDDNHKTKYKHDPHITKHGISAIKDKVQELIIKYGYPKEIYFSPFRRCIETMRIIVHELKKDKKSHYKNINLYCDVTLSRYFSKKEQKKPKVSKKTLEYNIPIKENKYEFHRRVKENANDMKKYGNDIWCITHALVYKNVARELNIVTNDHIDFLESFCNVSNFSNNSNSGELNDNQKDPTHPDYVPMKERFTVIKHSKSS